MFYVLDSARNDSECVVKNTIVECVGNATRRREHWTDESVWAVTQQWTPSYRSFPHGNELLRTRKLLTVVHSAALACCVEKPAQILTHIWLFAFIIQVYSIHPTPFTERRCAHALCKQNATELGPTSKLIDCARPKKPRALGEKSSSKLLNALDEVLHDVRSDQQKRLGYVGV